MSRGKRKTTVEPVNLDKIVTVIKTAHCPSRSGRSELSYQLGKDEALKLYIKITDNTGTTHHLGESSCSYWLYCWGHCCAWHFNPQESRA